MKFNLKAKLILSKDATPSLKEDITDFVNDTKKSFSQKNIEENKIEIKNWKLNKSVFSVQIDSEGKLRAHDHLLQLKNSLSKKIGSKHKIGVRKIKVEEYGISFELDKKPLKEICIPFAEVKTDGKKVLMILKDFEEDFLRENYVDRMINLIKDKTLSQYYEGKKEFWKLIWSSDKKQSVWNKDPTGEMIKLGWIKQGPSKGKWFFRPKAAAIIRAMEEIAVNEVIKPLGFQEIVESHIVPFDIWLKTGHLEGMPGEFYYVTEPATRDTEEWEEFIDLIKITKKIPSDDLVDNLKKPSAGICYAQCPLIYWSFNGKTISEESLPVLVYERRANSNRYESGGRHGIERTDEFHRIEPVYIGTREQLFELREKMIERYKHVFNDILDLEWRMAWVTPWYLQQAGKIVSEENQEKGTIDFEAYMPYRGSRKNSEWLEFQNLSIIGDKYVKAFNIKSQKSELWSGCSGIGLERWIAAFLAQKGLDPEKWPKGFKKYLSSLPKGLEFM